MKKIDPMPSARQQLIEVWGDTADTRHLAWSIVLGIGISLPAYLLGARLLAGIVSSPQLAKAYAMLAGLGGCVLAGIVCALLFKPKRVVEDQAADPFWREQVLDRLAEETGGLGSVEDLPAEVAREMKELEIYDLFLAHGSRPGKPAARSAPRQAATMVSGAVARGTGGA